MPAPGSTDAAEGHEGGQGPEGDDTEVITAIGAHLPPAEQEAMLRDSDLVVEGRMPWSSNATFLCELWPTGSRPDAGLVDRTDPEGVAASQAAVEEAREAGLGPLGRGIYKPHQGERPLWDFPDGLYRREAGAYDLACALGWDVVPPTVVADGPFGLGSVQWFVDADFEQHHFTLVEDEANHPQLRRMCAFDLVANSTDRKGGHVLVDPEGHLWGIDNGLCLHAEFKLRTVIWEFAHEPIPSELADDLAAFVEAPLTEALTELLDPLERDALRTRARALLSDGHFPNDPTGRRVPWPLV